MLSFKKFILLIESFKHAKSKWLSQSDIDSVDKAIEEFKYLKTRGVIPDEQKDIGYWNWSEPYNGWYGNVSDRDFNEELAQQLAELS